MKTHEGKGAFCKGMLIKSGKDQYAKSPNELIQNLYKLQNIQQNEK